MGLAFRVQGLGSGVVGLGCRDWGLAFAREHEHQRHARDCLLQGLVLQVSGFGFRVSGLGSRVWCSRFRVSGLVFRVSGLMFEA